MKRFSLLMMSALLAGCGAAQPPASVPEPSAAEAAKQPTLAAPPVTASQPRPTKSTPPETKDNSKEAQRPRRRFEPYAGPERRRRPQLHISAVAFSPDGKYMLTGYGVVWRPEKVGKRFQLLRLWDVATGQELCGFEEVQQSVVGVSFLPDSRHAVVGTCDGLVGVWDMDLEKLKIVRQFRASPSSLSALAISPDGKRVLTSGHPLPDEHTDGYVKLFDVGTGKLLWSRHRVHGAGCSRLLFTPDGKRATGWGIGMIGPWDDATGKGVERFEGKDEWKDYFQAFSPDGKTIVGSRDNRLVLWELATGRVLRQFERPHSTRPGFGSHVSATTAHFTPDGKGVTSADSDLSLRRWDVATGKQVDVLRIPDKVVDVDMAEEIAGGLRANECGIVRFSADGRFALSIIGWDTYGPPGDPPQDWDGDSQSTRLMLLDTVKFKALGPAVRKQIIRPLDPRIR